MQSAAHRVVTGKKVKMMEKQSNRHELLSALADGELRGNEIEQALALCADDDHRCWQTYQLIGDVLRAPALAQCSDPTKLIEGLRNAVRKDHSGTQMAVEQGVSLPASVIGSASNDSVFRWKMVAGFASLAAVAAIGWNSFNEWSGASAAGPQLASAAPAANRAPVVANAPSASTLQASAGPQVMIRDPRLDELLAAHKQFGGASALQMPAGFLRNATFETPEQ